MDEEPHAKRAKIRVRGHGGNPRNHKDVKGNGVLPLVRNPCPGREGPARGPLPGALCAGTRTHIGTSGCGHAKASRPSAQIAAHQPPAGRCSNAFPPSYPCPLALRADNHPTSAERSGQDEFGSKRGNGGIPPGAGSMPGYGRCLGNSKFPPGGVGSTPWCVTSARGQHPTSTPGTARAGRTMVGQIGEATTKNP